MALPPTSLRATTRARTRHGSRRTATERSPTGIDGFDDITGGGLPRGRVTLAVGGFGSGKTVFALQCLVNGARASREPGIFVAFEERAQRIIANASHFGWDLPALTRAKLFFLDAHLLPADEQIGDFTLEGLLAGLAAKAQRMGARRIVFDGIDNLLDRLEQPSARRREMVRLHDWLHRLGLTAVITAKSDPMVDQAYGFLQFMVECVIELRHHLVDRIALRSLRVLKFRGGDASTNEFPMSIAADGMEVARHGTLGLEYPVSSRRMPLGVARLDAMLSGGVYRGTTTLVSGQPGTAKSSLAGAFARAASERGERSLYISFDESGDQIARNLASIGIRLHGHVAKGVLRLLGLRSESQAAEAHFLAIQSLIREHRPSCLVIDPISALSKAGGASGASDVAVRLLAMAKSAGITTLCTSLLHDVASNVEATSLQISTIADTWIHLANLAMAGERNRTLTVVKSRGTAHSHQVREMVLGRKGITLADVYTSDGEVLMGTLRWAKEASDRLLVDQQRLDYVRQRREIESANVDSQLRSQAISREIELRRLELEALEQRERHRLERSAKIQAATRHRRGGDGEAIPRPPRRGASG